MFGHQSLSPEAERINREAERQLAEARANLAAHQEQERARIQAIVEQTNAGVNLAHEERQRQEQAAEREREQALQAREQARLQAEEEAYRRQARAAFIGTDADFDAAWPELWASYQRDEARRRMEANAIVMGARVRRAF